MPRPSPVRFAALALVLGGIGAVLPACHGGSEKEFCQKVHDVPQFASAFGTFDPADPAAAKAAYLHAVEALRALESASPSSVRGDVGKLADVAADLATALADVDDPATAADRLVGMKAELDGVAAASAHVTAYAADRCHVELGPAPSTVPTTVPSATTSTSSG